MRGCGANPEKSQTGDYMITGTVAVDGVSKAGAYVRLLNKDGEFVAESPTSKAGTFTFFAAPRRVDGSVDPADRLGGPAGGACRQGGRDDRVLRLVRDVPHVFCPRNVSRASLKYAREWNTIYSWEMDYQSDVPHFVWELSLELFSVFFSVVIGVE